MLPKDLVHLVMKFLEGATANEAIMACFQHYLRLAKEHEETYPTISFQTLEYDLRLTNPLGEPLTKRAQMKVHVEAFRSTFGILLSPTIELTWVTDSDQFCSWDVCGEDNDPRMAPGEWVEGKEYKLPAPIESYVPRDVVLPSRIMVHLVRCRNLKSFGMSVDIDAKGLLSTKIGAREMVKYLFQ